MKRNIYLLGLSKLIVATLGFILDSHFENLASFSLQDGAPEWHYSLTWTTNPPTANLFSVNVVRYPHPNYSHHQEGMSVSPP